MAWLLSFKIMLMSAGVLSMALALKVSVPLAMEYSISYVPLIWSSLLSCLRPPYVYIIINGIIISIVASTRLQQKHADGYVEIPSAKVPEDMVYKEIVHMEYAGIEAPAVHERRDELIIPEVKAIEAIDEVIFSDVKVIEAIDSVVAEAEEDDKFVISASPAWTSPETMKLMEKPLVSSRFAHRKSAKSSPEGGKALGVVSKAKRHETLENTWKAITEGRAMPLSRHMKKCETWENHSRPINVGQMEPSPVKKSETFKDRTNQTLVAVDLAPQPMKIRKEPLLSHDDLNRRVEDFINKFNMEMRLQREQSLKKYWDMVSRGDN